MIHSGRAVLTVAVLGVGLLAGGCCDKEKKEIAALYAEKNELMEQNRQLQDQIAQASQREADLLGQVSAKDSELARMRQNVQMLQAKLSQPRPEPPQTTPKGWEVGKYADRVTVGSDVLFAAGRATLTAAGKRKLDAIVRDLKTTYSGLPVKVYGYTDSDPIRRTKRLWQDNLDLSANRAMSVTRYLISKGIPAENIETVAMGATHFVADNATPAGKAKNRRVEIYVLKTTSK